jgi:hypothetical protein
MPTEVDELAEEWIVVCQIVMNQISLDYFGAAKTNI